MCTDLHPVTYFLQMTQTLGSWLGSFTLVAMTDCGFAKSLDGSFQPGSNWLLFLRATIRGEICSGVIFNASLKIPPKVERCTVAKPCN